MKTLEEKAREWSETYNEEEDKATAFTSYIEGYNVCNAEWQEKTRWKKVRRDKDGFLILEQESELCKHFQILTKGIYGMKVIEILGGDLEKLEVCTHWKEII